MQSLTYALLIVFLAFANAVPILLQDEEGQQYSLTPILSRQRRQSPQIFGGGGASSVQQAGTIGFKNPNGSGATVGYAHAKGYGHDVSLDAMVPVWSHKTRKTESTVNLGGGVSQHYGGWGGNKLMDKRVGISFVHRF